MATIYINGERCFRVVCEQKGAAIARAGAQLYAGWWA